LSVKRKEQKNNDEDFRDHIHNNSFGTGVSIRRRKKMNRKEWLDSKVFLALYMGIATAEDCVEICRKVLDKVSELLEEASEKLGIFDPHNN
jgi:hypothetical protein